MYVNRRSVNGGNGILSSPELGRIEEEFDTGCDLGGPLCNKFVMPGLTRHPVGRLRGIAGSHLDSGIRRNDASFFIRHPGPPPNMGRGFRLAAETVPESLGLGEEPCRLRGVVTRLGFKLLQQFALLAGQVDRCLNGRLNIHVAFLR